MSSAKHVSDTADLNKPYEENEIGLKGILGFAIGLFLLIVITFGLMWALLSVLKNDQRENADPANPMAMSEKEKLPPEPRVQLAPGFGVDSEKGRVNLELLPPQSEYRELRAQWEAMWRRGLKDEKTGTVTVLPIEEAKTRVLSMNLRAKSGADAQEFFNSSKTYVSDAGSGRMASEKRR
jgi:hypothetical protein